MYRERESNLQLEELLEDLLTKTAQWDGLQLCLEELVRFFPWNTF